MVSKTRDKLIEVARQLFTNKGVENTTMNDIAAASEKGRRTIYTYFKSKREIYNAVVEKHSEKIIENLKAIALSDAHPAEKLHKFLLHRFHLAAEYSPKHDAVFYHFFDRDFKRLERVHKLATVKGMEMLKSILEQGIVSGVFIPEQCERLLCVYPALFLGVDFCMIRSARDESDVVGRFDPESGDDVVKFLVAGILKKE